MGCDIHAYLESRENSSCPWTYTKKLDIWRDYTLFGVLANVRTRDDIVPISDPKGMPTGVSKEVIDEYEQWDSDGHSHSYITKDEFLNYDFYRITKFHGILSNVSFKSYLRTGTVDSYSSMVGGSLVKIHNKDQMQILVDSGNDTDKDYCRMDWTECLADNISAGLTVLKLIFENTDNYEYRMIFWFDN